ncbi:hypothetical protein LIER_13370 [Lithospermum erythrorhizon]|uniref:KOW domain-containing protein n=1 Tax=Lithospermum erythrorhizon TaxID=34254 RepID=A0AAV3PXD2_LITER
MSSWKGKEKVVTEGKSGKRSRHGGESGARKRRNRAVLELFEDAAYEVDGESSSDGENDFDIDDFLEDEAFNDVKANDEPLKVPLVPIKEEEMDDAELERMVEERYGRGASFVRFPEDGYDNTEAVDRDEYLPFSKDPTLWKVKCMVGREKHSVLCLMQKFVDLRTLGTKLQIISAFSLDHVKGFIYIEAESQQDLYEACKGLPSVYVSRVTPVPPNESSHVLSVRSKGCGITAGMWARVKSGKYKADLAQIVAVNEARKKATVKLVPRIDLRALAEKFGGGVSLKKASTPAPSRLISSSELEEFRPLIQIRRDRDTNIIFEVLDGMMLKDGYLYKKIPLDSLSVWGAMPTEDELLKFEPSNNNESMDLEFLSDLYGNANKKKKQIMKNDKGGGKGECSSTSNVEYNFDVHDLVFFGKKDFGVIIGTEKDDNFKIMKEGTERPLVLTLPARDLKSASFDKKLFTAQDRHMKKISISDRVKVMDGPFKDKEGVVKRIYRGVIFLFNESEEDHNGYVCFKSQICEKVISAGSASHEQGNEPGPSGFDESPSSPNSPLSTKKSWQGRENSSLNQEDNNAMFSVGQSLRIKVGPLKGYLCRVLAIRRSDVTVKLDSQHKILTVKSDHLSEVRGRSSANVTGGDQESAQPFDLLGATDGSRDWANGTTESRGWNVGVAPTEGTSWPSFPASGNKIQSESGAVTDTIGGDSGWSSADTRQVDRWGKQQDDGSTSVAATGTADSWGKAIESRNENIGQGSSWGGDTGGVYKAASNSEPGMDKQTEGWSNAGCTEASGWAKPTRKEESQTESWGTKKTDTGGGAGWGQGGSTWGKASESENTVTTKEDNSWGDKAEHQQSKKDGDGGSSWGKRDGGSSWNKKDSEATWSKQADEGSSWGKQADAKPEESRDQGDKNQSWGNQGGNSWKKQDGGSSWNKDGGSSWSKPTGSSWGQRADAKAEEVHDRTAQNQSWGNQAGASWNKQDGGSSWKGKDGGSGMNKPTGGSSWGQQADAKAEDHNTTSDKQPSWGNQGGGSWNKQDTGSSWGKLAGGSSWGKQAEANVEPSNAESVDGKAGGSKWSAAKPSDGGGWEMNSKSSNKTESSGWGSSSSWNQKGDGNSTDLEKRDQSESWDIKKTSDGGSSSGWGKGNWGKSSTDDAPGNQNSAWSSKTDWDAGNDYSGSQEQVDKFSRGGGRGSWRGRGGRGESNRGGFGGRDGSGRGGFMGRGNFGGRDGSERGGYRGRSDRGGFRGRGRGRSDQFGGDWNNRNDSGEEKPTSWSKSSWNSDGGRSNENKGNWNQGGADSGQQKGWSSGSHSKGDMEGGDGDGGQRKSWSSGGGWSKPGNSGGWNQGSASGCENNVGGDGDGGQKKSWSSGGSWSNPCSNAGWNKGSASGSGNNDGADGDGGQKKSWSSGGSWSKPGNNADWNQGSASGSGKSDGDGGGQKKGWSLGGSWSKPGNNAGWNQGTASGSGKSDGTDGDGGQKKSWSSGGSWSKPGNNGSGNSGGWNQGSASGGGTIDGADGGQRKSSSAGDSWSKPDSNAGWNQGSASVSGNTSGAWNKPCDTDGGNAGKVNDASESGGPTNSWGSAAASSWEKPKGGW